MADWRETMWAIHAAARGPETGSPNDRHFLMLALCGEVGELANIVKKQWRRDFLPPLPTDKPPGELAAMLVDEMADVMAYLYLLARCYRVDLDEAVERKVPEVIRRYRDVPGVAEALAALPVTLPAERRASPVPPWFRQAYEAFEAEQARQEVK